MEKVALGRSGLKVSPLCFGTWELGGEWGAVDEKAATATIRRAREAGINFFDTAQGYGFGASERLLGTALAVDFIDLYQVHWPDPNTPLAATAAALGELVNADKIRHVGVSNFGVDQMEAFAQHGPLETLQPPYHMFRREIEDSV